MRFHEAVAATEFPKPVQEAVLECIKGKPWSKPFAVQVSMIKALLAKLAEQYEVQVPTLIMAASPMEAATAQISNEYRTQDNTILLSVCSVLTTLHEFRHAMQAQGKVEGMFGEPLDEDELGRRERDAYEWSCSLFYIVAPRRFAKMVERGRIVGVDATDLW